MNLSDIKEIIALVEAIIRCIEVLDPNAANNPIVIKLEGAIAKMHSMSL